MIGPSFAYKFSMTKPQTIFGLVAPYEWDELGNPVKLKICAEGEIDYFVLENEMEKALFKLIRNWVSVKGRILNFDSMKVIEIEEISSQK